MKVDRDQVEQCEVKAVREQSISLKDTSLVADVLVSVDARGKHSHGLLRLPRLEYLIIDLPPGTGDVQLSLVQHLSVREWIETPFDLAGLVLVRGQSSRFGDVGENKAVATFNIHTIISRVVDIITVAMKQLPVVSIKTADQ